MHTKAQILSRRSDMDQKWPFIGTEKAPAETGAVAALREVVVPLALTELATFACQAPPQVLNRGSAAKESPAVRATGPGE